MKRRAQSASLTRRLTPMAMLGGRLSTMICIALSVGALVFSSVNPQTAQGIRLSVNDLAAPLLGAISAPIHEAALFVRNVTGLAELQAENMRLTQENMRLREWYQAAQLYQSENHALRDLLNLKAEMPKSYITARVLVDSGNAFARSLLVAGGQKDGVEKGQAVISGSGAVGRIIEAGDEVSRILLLSDINSRVPVMIEGTGTHAILAGQNDDQPRLERLPSGYKPEEGARVMTSGVGGLYPQGLPVGRVQETDQGLRVMLYANPSQLLYVRVIENREDSVLQSIDATP